MAITVEVARSTPFSLAYRATYDGVSGTGKDLLIDAAGGASPDLVTDASGLLKKVLAQTVTSVEKASRLLMGDDTDDPVLDPNVAGEGLDYVCQLVLQNRLVFAGNTSTTWAASPAYNAATNRARLYLQVHADPDNAAIATVELRLRHSLLG